MNNTNFRVGHCTDDSYNESCTIYAGRKGQKPNRKHMNNTAVGEPGWLGNPYPMDEGYTRSESIELFLADFLERIEEDPEFRERLWELKQEGVDFVCWCQTFDEDGPACHAEVISRAVQGMEKQSE